MSSSATFRRDVSALAEVFAFVGEFFSAEGVDPRLRFTVDFVVEELFTNFVKYNPSGECGIDVGLAVEGEELKLSLTDCDSEPFDIRKDAPEVRTDLPLEERTPGGLGVHLVKKMMDRIEYQHENRVSTITLYKNLRSNRDARDQLRIGE